MAYRNLISRAFLSVVALSLVAAKGCTVDGDASLGNDGDSEPAASAGTSATTTAGAAGKATGTPSGTAGTSASPATGGASAGEPAVGEGVAGEPAQPTAGAASTGDDVCALPLDTGPCKGNLPRYGFDAQAGHCQLFTYGGCQGNTNSFATLAECQAACGDAPTCPSFLQTSLVYEVAPLNRPERACVVFANPLHVGCSELLNPSLTVPTDWPTHPCATKDGKLALSGCGDDCHGRPPDGYPDLTIRLIDASTGDAICDADVSVEHEGVTTVVQPNYSSAVLTGPGRYRISARRSGYGDRTTDVPVSRDECSNIVTEHVTIALTPV